MNNSKLSIQNKFTSQTNAALPVIMAPMFLVSNLAMIKSAMQNGIVGTFPTLNFREEGELDSVLKELNNFSSQGTNMPSYGVNLIVQKTNPLYEKHLKICIQCKVPFFITSLGNPKDVIKLAHAYGAKVYCDVTNFEHAHKSASAGCDGFIAVGAGAGGHAGNIPLNVLVPALKKKYPEMPVMAAGGISTGEGIASMLMLGADGASIGTRFIACDEAKVNDQYKTAIINAGMEDLMLTTRLSGTPCNVIKTEDALRMGAEQNWFERLLNNNPKTKKYFKMLVQFKGMKKLEKAIKPGNYKNLWSAGMSVEFIDSEMSVAEIVKQLDKELYETLKKSNNFIAAV